MVIVPPELQWRKEPKQKRSRILVEKVLDAALLLADEQGLAAFNTNAVARQAGVDIASVYQYFPNKESILFWTAERWLRRIHEACREMERPEHSALAWRDFFARYGEMFVALPEYKRAYSSMRSLWVLYPEYQELGNEHRDYMVDFIVRHCMRFGATTDPESLRGMATYLYVSSDAVLQTALTSASPDADALHEWNNRTWMLLLERVLPG